MANEVRRDDADAIITVTFTRVAKRNAVTPSMWDVLRQAVRDLGDDDAQRVLVITAEGSYLTSGFDYADLRPNVGEGTDGVVRGSTMRRQYRAEAYHDLFDEMESIEKPIILAAQGHCVGVGVEMGASCDFRFAATNATFSLPEVANIATLPGSGGISRLDAVNRPALGKVVGDGQPNHGRRRSEAYRPRARRVPPGNIPGQRPRLCRQAVLDAS